MTEKQLLDILKGKILTFTAICQNLSISASDEKEQLKSLLDVLIRNGVVYKSKNDYSLLSDRNMILAKVTSKYKNFVLLKSIPENNEIKISGIESDSYLVGDILYLKSFKRDEYHAIDALEQVKSLKGSFSLNNCGKEILLVSSLANTDKTVYIIDKEKDLNPVQGDYLECDIIAMNKTMIQVKAKKILVKVNELGGDISRIILKNDAPISFSDKTLEEVKHIEDKVSDIDKKDRVDYTSHLIYTIDGNDSHDFDDAVEIEKYLEGYKAVVHIADVTHYMKPNSSLDEDAFLRGTSIYVADRVIPMLPFELSNGICSLNPNVERLALSCTMLIDAQGNVFSSKVEKTIIKSKARLTYEKVNAFYNGEEVDYSKEIKDSLLLLKKVSDLIRKRRDKNGAMNLSSIELKFHLDENGIPVDVIKEEQHEAEKVIEDFMIIANCSVAKLLKDNNIPVLYRIHENPPSDKVIAFKDFLRKVEPKLLSYFPKNDDITSLSLMEFMTHVENDKVKYAINSMLLRTMAKAKYSPDDVGHFGLAEDYYCHFTSPIRRYPDDIIHRLVKDYLIGGKTFKYDEIENELYRDGKFLSLCEIRADSIERQVDDLESCKYLMNKIGMVLHGRISALLVRGMFIETDLGIEGFLPYHCIHGDVFKFDERGYVVKGKHHEDITFSLGDDIDICVIYAAPDNLEIDFSTPEFYNKYLKEKTVEQIYVAVRDGVHIDKPVEKKPIYLHSYDEIKKINEETEYKIVTNSAGFTSKVAIQKEKHQDNRRKDNHFKSSNTRNDKKRDYSSKPRRKEGKDYKGKSRGYSSRNSSRNNNHFNKGRRVKR